jgi:serine/threonine protein kinase
VAEPAAQTFGRYRVTGTLGKGAMGEVYLAVDEVLGREVAVKTLKSGTTGLGARLLDERFRLEARAIASFAHPGVVQVFDIDLAADPPYLVMERVSGPSLKERLAERTLVDREVRALGIQIANALAAAHAVGVVHRDVKPANILAAGDGAWKLADFGVAHVPDSSLTITGQFVGSPAYAPPEALLRGQLGPAGDIYGLGATIYQAIAGRWPRSDSDTGALLAPVPPLASIAPSVAPAVADIIDRAVAMEPEKRPTAAEFAAALARAASQPIAVSSPSLPPPEQTEFVSSQFGASPVSLPAAPTPAKNQKWQKYAFMAGLLAIIVVIVISRRSPSPPSVGPSHRPTPGVLPPPQPTGPHTINAAQPPINSHKAAKDWNKIVDKLHDHDFAEARKKLDEFERKHGSSPETRSLAAQLDSLPPEAYEDD